MKVYVVSGPGGVAVFATEQLAVAHAEQSGAAFVDECEVAGAEPQKPRVQVRHANGYTAPNGPSVTAVSPRVGPDGSEFVRQPGPVPENRRPPYVPSAGSCATCNAALMPNGYCPRCFPQMQVVQSWPTNAPAPPTPGAEHM